MYASCNGHFKIVKLLIKNGANKNEKNNNSQDALYLAKKYKQIKIIKYLQKKNKFIK